MLIVLPVLLSQVMINRTELPGAILFPSIKYKEIWVEVPATEPAVDTKSAATSDAVEVNASTGVPASDVNTTAEGGQSSAVTTCEGESPDKPSAVEKDTTTGASIGGATVADNAGVFRLMFEMQLSLLFIRCL